MKLTWFGGTTLRVYIGGKILILDPMTIGGVDRAELVSGADQVFGLMDELPPVDARQWQPRRAPTMLDEAEGPDVLVHRLEPGVLLVDAVGEPPLVVAAAPVSSTGRWGTSAVVIVVGREPSRTALGTLNVLKPRLIAVAGDESAVDSALAAIGGRLETTGFMALDRGLALEI